MVTKEKILEVKEKFDVNIIFAQRVLTMVDQHKQLDEIAKIINDRPKPFVKWVGGKRQLLKQFREMDLYPPHDFDPINSTYYEPSVGGGAVFFDLLPKKAVLSDLNKELVITYNVIKNNIDKFIKSLKKHKYEKEYFLKVRAKNLDKLSDLEIASRFIYFDPPNYPVSKTASFACANV